jgi:hypothetical protein
MIIKAIETRDRDTFMPAIAIKMVASSEAERYLLSRTGYGRNPGKGVSGYPLVMLLPMRGGAATYDPYSWEGGARTWPEAHRWIEQHFDEINDGDVVDVEYLLGETDTPKISERFAFPN